MQSLGKEQFPDFFQAVHGREAFDWQSRLASEVLADGFHDVIRVPTGCGKTSVLDVAIFALALEAERDPEQRTAARRICFVVDRRLVVDDVTEHAHRIHNAIFAAAGGKRSEPVLKAVAERLASLAVERDNPLRVVRLRGGVYRDDGWSADPLTPSILVSTVDQIGSRLLFRGYGVSDRSRPLQAGLLAFDTRIILDEAHLSSVFTETLAGVRRFQSWAEHTPLAPSRLVNVVEMSATATAGGRTFELSKAERNDQRLAGRLGAHKLAELIEVPVDAVTKQLHEKQPAKAREQERKNRDRFVDEVVEQVKKLAGIGQKEWHESQPWVVGVVVNRVATARRVFKELSSPVEEESKHDVILLTGRIRPYDRDRLLQKWLSSMKAGREAPPDRRLIVVATQTIEVGANLDFDALVTEAASLDALRQRFGRLDRLGRRHDRDWTSPARILVRSDQKRHSESDPVYGRAIAESWKWLTGKATTDGSGASKKSVIDFGIEHLDPKIPTNLDELGAMCAPRPDAPTLLPAHLDAWVQTDPVPVPDPDVAPFLHGRADALADVQVIWRADLQIDDEHFWVRTVSLMPPRTREALPVPLHEVRAWLNGVAEANVADIEGVAIGPVPVEGARPRRALRWRGAKYARAVDPSGVRPGDTIVVPGSYGGADEYGWNPAARAPVEDVADACLAEVIASYPANAFRPPELRLRLHSDLLPEPDQATPTRFLALLETAVHAVSADAQDPWPSIRRLLDGLRASLHAPAHRAAAAAVLEASSILRLDLYPDGSGIVLRGAVRVRLDDGADAACADAEYEEPEDDATSIMRDGREVGLSEHGDSVGKAASESAHNCGLPADLVEPVEMAGRWHDEGKRDPRFQAWLHGSELRALAALWEDRPLAKSGRDAKDWKDPEPFGYPRGSRHEFVSVRLFDQAGAQSGKNDGLARFLIGTHHGHGRPFPPVLNDPEPRDIALTQDGKRIATTSDHGLYRLDSGWVDLFWRMVRRYGWWGVAYLEALVITADRSVSAREQRVTVLQTSPSKVKA